MYTPSAFAENDPAELDGLVAEYDFATLVTSDPAGVAASHVPILYDRGDRIVISGHLARANPQARSAGRALVIVQGPHAYVSPSWYPDKVENARVPTWNYVVAHFSGELELFDDEASLADVVDRLGVIHESRAAGTWRFDRANPAERTQLRGIIGFRLHVERVEMKAKLSQNHPEANRRAVAARLLAANDPREQAVGRRMDAALAARKQES